MRLTLIHPCIGRRAGDRGYIRSWQMEPLPSAVIAGLTPRDVEIRFYDDRLEDIPFDEPTDVVALSVETYTARRCYQIASEYRRRGVPVVMGGFHATLCTEEVARFADVVIVGEAEDLWAEVLDDLRHGTQKPLYRSDRRPSLAGLRPDRSIFRKKRYLPFTLIEAGRGCHFRCDFCAIQSFFGATQTRRPIDTIVEEIRSLERKRGLLFFVDDNITSNLEDAKAFYRALIPLGLRWISQASINAAHDEEFLDLIARSGCEGLLIGFESLEPETLRQMKKSFNTMGGGYEVALKNLKRFNIRLYGTFLYGYDFDTPQSFADSVDFAIGHGFYIAAFNHLTPFPGTPLYQRLEAEGRLVHDAWWLEPSYGYNQIPFRPKNFTPAELQRHCFEARRKFYSYASIARRFANPVNRASFFMARNFPAINLMLRREVQQRDDLPLGHAGWQGDLLPVGAAGGERSSKDLYLAG